MTRRSPTGFLGELAIDAPDYRAAAAPSIARKIAMARIRTRRRPFYNRRLASPRVATARQVQGQQLSFNNINDTDAAFECVGRIRIPAAVAAVVTVKHGQSVRRGAGREPRARPMRRLWPATRLGLRRHRRHEPTARRAGCRKIVDDLAPR